MAHQLILSHKCCFFGTKTASRKTNILDGNIPLPAVLQIVKFCRAQQQRVPPLSDVDVGVLQLQRSERLLEERLQTLAEKADGCELPLAASR